MTSTATDPRNRQRTLWVIGVVGALVALGITVWLLDFDESAGVEVGVTLSDLVEDPARYAGREVTISGEVSESAYFTLADADVLLAIGDDAGEELVVIPRPGVDVPQLTEDFVLRVRGTVHVVEPERPANRMEGILTQGGILAENGPEPLIMASEVEWVGEERFSSAGPEQPAMEVTVRMLLEDPRAYDDLPVVVRGRAYPVGDVGFALVQDGRSIFVGAPYSDLGDLDAGERVRVRAELERLSQFRADTIIEALRGTPETDASTPEGVDLDQVPSEEGRPFLVLRTITERRPAAPGTPESP